MHLLTLALSPAPPPGLADVDLRAWRRQKFQAVFFGHLNYLSDVLLLLRAHRADFLKEPFEAGRGDDTHQTTRRLAKITVGVRYPTRRENRRAFLGGEFFAANRPLVLTLEDLKRLV